jgi:predicted nucleic acid-binding protein
MYRVGMNRANLYFWCETGKLAGEYLRKFSRSHGLTTVDALIAAAAIRHYAALWTRNRERYPMQELSFYD